MNTVEADLKKFVEDLHLKIKAGIKPEAVKVELKREWYDLNKSSAGVDYKYNVSKFLKSITGLANTYGLTGHLVIGIDEKTGAISEAAFSKSGLNDRTELYGLIVRNVDKPIRYDSYEIVTDIDGANKTVTVFVVPPSLDKPHVIADFVTKNEKVQNFIPVKKETGTFPANRTDIDLMYYDKQNIIPEYAVDIKAFGKPPSIHQAGGSVSIRMPLVFENYGRKPIVLVKFNLIIMGNAEAGVPDDFVLFLGNYSVPTGIMNTSEFGNRPIIVPSNNAVTFFCMFGSWAPMKIEQVANRSFEYYFTAEDIVGNKYNSEKYRK